MLDKVLSGTFPINMKVFGFFFLSECQLYNICLINVHSILNLLSSHKKVILYRLKLTLTAIRYSIVEILGKGIFVLFTT